MVISGLGVLIGLTWLLSLIGAPAWLVLLPWLVPAVGTAAWALVRPRPAIATDDDDDSWVGYAVQFVLVGEDEPRAAPARFLAGLVFGAPVVWSLTVFGLSTLAGLF